MKRQMVLDYTLVFGALAPYAEAVRAGEALASVCQHCGHTAFPARIVCPQCTGNVIAWKKLSGRARILQRTAGLEQTFALVQFDGAETRSIVRLHAIDPHLSHGRLIAPHDELIGLWLGADAPDSGKED
ncbi:hypothetical protein PSC71_07260 [Devosia sp. J2-20]|uniref:Zn-ribbon domain-containing OB-fold protein n=1 Tax=Devosia sp. J2-20 TaxID=3026161 RepID=UPI00249B2B69|nr:zinc ribbon domain-containing protein [Devosia sp. J2-20]WDR00548.1 hypothetical protein PSC71_07260 [Devosia sp. J2-20]